MIDTTDLTAGVSRAELTRIVMAAHPELIATMERAGEEYYRNDAIWQAECARQQRAAGLPQQSLESPYGKVLRQASTAVLSAFDALTTPGGGHIP